jgi:hypothetical protein
MARFIVVAPLLSSPPEPQSIDLQSAVVSVQARATLSDQPTSFPEAEGYGAQATVA